MPLYYKRRKRFTKDQKEKSFSLDANNRCNCFYLFFKIQLQKNTKLPLKKGMMKCSIAYIL